MITLDELKERYATLLGCIIPLHTIEGEIFRNLEIVELAALGNEVKIRIEIKVLAKWLYFEGELTSGLVFSIVDEITPPVQLVFNTQKATSVEIKISLLERKIFGRVLYCELICSKPNSSISQTFIKITDGKKLIAVAHHNKIYLKQEFKAPKL